MNALQRLEQGGYQFVLQDGKMTFSYHGHDDPPEQWALPLMAEVRTQRETVRTILQARLDWLALYEAWCGRPTSETEDAATIARLAELAIVGLLPCYADGEHDAGAKSWGQLAARYTVSSEHTKEVVPMSAETPRQLPWAIYLVGT